MRRTKKFTALAMAAAMAFTLAGCSNSGTASTTAATTEKAASAETTAAGTAAAGTAAAESAMWPEKDVTVIVPASAGGGTDIFARAVTDYLQRSTGKTFTVVNVDAGSGMVGFEQCRNAKPDGSTIMFWHTGFYVTNASGQYEHSPNTAFSPLVMFRGEGDDAKQVFVVKGDSPINNMNDLIEAAKAAPGTITYGCSVGGSAQLVAEMIMQAGDVDIRLVDAASQTDKITGVAGGNITVSAITYGGAVQYVESGDLKIIGVVDKEGTDEYQSASEQGLENCYWTQELCVFGPAGLDEDLCKAINEVFAGMNDDETLINTLTTSKMLKKALDYDASMSAFADYEKTVGEAASKVDWN